MPLACSSTALGQLAHRRQLRSTSLRRARSGVERAGHQARQVAVERADRRRDRHLVVVEDDQQVGVRARRRCSAPRTPCRRSSRRRRSPRPTCADSPLSLAATAMPSAALDRRRRVRGAEGVVLALVAARKAGDAARTGAAVAMPLAAAGQHLVGIGLVADVPDDAVVRRVEDVMQRDRQLDRAEIRRQMAAGPADRIDDELAQLVRRAAAAAGARACADRPGRRSIRADWSISALSQRRCSRRARRSLRAPRAEAGKRACAPRAQLSARPARGVRPST